MEVFIIKSDQEKLWDDYVLQNPFSYPQQLFGWKRILEKTYGLETLYLVAWENGNIVGALPLFKVQGRWLRNYLSSLPGGIIADREDIARTLFEHAKSFTQELQANYLKVRDNTYSWNLSPEVVVEQTSILDLTVGTETIWKNFKSEARNRIRKAEKSGLQIDMGKKYLTEFYEVLATNFRDMGTPIFSFHFFQDLVKEFPEAIELFVIKLGNKVISEMFLFSFRNTLYSPFIAGLKDYSSYCSNDLLYWEAIQYASHRGFESFNFGKNRKDSGAARFKQKFNVKPKDLYDYYYLNRVPEIPKIGRTSWKVQALRAAWKKLPVGLTKKLGPIVRKDLPFG
jgi:FemAB-related protein (PEP-CTERM system-associated)